MAEVRSVLVTATEKRILDSLRELPDGQLKDLAERFLIELTEMLRDPKCTEVQADGYPCDTPAADCEHCLKLRELLDTLRGVLPQT